jgi:hypothetical protein
MIELDAILWRQNARLRAWYTLGVPLLGQWRVRATRGSHGLLTAMPWSCMACELNAGVLNISLPLATAAESAEILTRMMDSAEIGGVWDLLYQGCGHLVPMLGADPPELAGLFALELLAGDPATGS